MRKCTIVESSLCRKMRSVMSLHRGESSPRDTADGLRARRIIAGVPAQTPCEVDSKHESTCRSLYQLTRYFMPYDTCLEFTCN